MPTPSPALNARAVPGLPPRALVGMIHLDALPGTPRASRRVSEIADLAAADARLLTDAGFDAVLAVRSATRLPVGVQVLAGANEAALAICVATGACFLRAEGFAYAAVADEGLLDRADAGPLLRRRRELGAEGVAILADVRKKHSSHAITADLGLAELVAGTEFSGADAVVITGVATGHPTSPTDLEVARAACHRPVVVGSGADAATVRALLDRADAVIVGSSIKHDGCWSSPIDGARARAFVAAARGR